MDDILSPDVRSLVANIHREAERIDLWDNRDGSFVCTLSDHQYCLELLVDCSGSQSLLVDCSGVQSSHLCPDEENNDDNDAKNKSHPSASEQKCSAPKGPLAELRLIYCGRITEGLLRECRRRWALAEYDAGMIPVAMFTNGPANYLTCKISFTCGYSENKFRLCFSQINEHSLLYPMIHEAQQNPDKWDREIESLSQELVGPILPVERRVIPGSSEFLRAARLSNMPTKCLFDLRDLSAVPFDNHRGAIEWFLGSDGKQVTHLRDAEPELLKGPILLEAARYETIYSATDAYIRGFFATYTGGRCHCVIAVYWDSHHFQYIQLAFLGTDKWFRLHFVQGGDSNGSGRNSIDRVQCVLEPIAINALTLNIVWNDRKKKHKQFAVHLVSVSVAQAFLEPLWQIVASFLF